MKLTIYINISHAHCAQLYVNTGWEWMRDGNWTRLKNRRTEQIIVPGDVVITTPYNHLGTQVKILMTSR